ncbi:rhodanese-like domain-containing protein 4A, chloroplastic isoform X2 [Malania oleifera]|uniref:rhodanese-like domain-containing protein 4A, chloroplastic isoform X2 n=1 Tax=Malania oleifera TaxID=397392 RepID=UPI0025AE8CB2|nr:rhodanese-like domain-containing protein 4A, chloroplastic isoform X2 [Malania oleifera]
MEFLSVFPSFSLPLRNYPKACRPKFNYKTISLPPNSLPMSDYRETQFPSAKENPSSPLHNHNNVPVVTDSPPSTYISLKTHLGSLLMGLVAPLSSLASEVTAPAEQVTDKINLESIIVSIDDFFNRNPFFVSGVTFIWLVVIPLIEDYFSKWKYISAIDAFEKLREDPNAQLLDIRNRKSVVYLGSPNLKILNKRAVQVHFSEGDEDGFVQKVLENFADPANTTLCILDNFDGNSLKGAELLFKNGFKEAYALKGGVRGEKGWQETQKDRRIEALLS